MTDKDILKLLDSPILEDNIIGLIMCKKNLSGHPNWVSKLIHLYLGANWSWVHFIRIHDLGMKELDNEKET